MSKDYKILTLDEGKLVAVTAFIMPNSPHQGGRGIAGGNVCYTVSSGTLIEFLSDIEEDDQRIATQREIDTGKIFQRTIPGHGTFIFFETEKLPLDTFITASNELFGMEGEFYEKANILKQKYGLKYTDVFTDDRNILGGVIEFKSLQNAKADDVPITEIKPVRPPQGGGGAGSGGGTPRSR